MKKTSAKMMAAALSVAALAGCTSTVTTTNYDGDGKIVSTVVSEHTDLSRLADGTNVKSQQIMVDGTYLSFELSATAGENCTPGVLTRYMNGRTLFVNQLREDQAKFGGVPETVREFFASKVEMDSQGVKAVSGSQE